MRLPGTPSLLLLAYLLLFLPWVAWRSARRLREARERRGGLAAISREAVWAGILWSQGALLVLAWLTGRSFGYEVFAVPSLGLRDALAAAVALASSFGLRSLLRVLRNEPERRRLVVYLLAPRTRRERGLWVAAVLLASVAEEAAYRGVAFSILWYSLGNPWVAALVCAAAFALAHSAQGGKSMAVVFLMALVAHGLVAFTRTLVLAMVVHALYDLVAGLGIARQARRYDEEGGRGPDDRKEDGGDHRRALDHIQPEA